MNKESRIRNFTDLNTWQEAHKLVILVYNLTKTFPKEELYGLASQIKRAVVSISSNIAEGFGRQSFQEKVHFFVIGHGSLTGVQNQLLVARDVGYINQTIFENIYGQSVVVHKLLNGLIKSTKERT